jgi:hypothetical protein
VIEMKAPTKDGFRQWMEDNPTCEVVCEDMSLCIIAQYAADCLLEEGEQRVGVDVHAFELEVEATDGGSVSWTEWKTAPTKPWVERVIRAFDSLEGYYNSLTGKKLTFSNDPDDYMNGEEEYVNEFSISDPRVQRAVRAAMRGSK